MQNNKKLLRSCLRTLRILEVLSSGEEMGVTEIGKYTGLHKSTAFRFLETLEHEGYVKQNPCICQPKNGPYINRKLGQL